MNISQDKTAICKQSVETIKKVLVVDDSKSQRITLSALLKKVGYEVTTAADSAEALEIIKDNPPPFIISDWIMPGLSGPQLCRTIRKTYPDGNIYLILLTSKSDKADVSAGLRAGADDFLSKPLHKEELYARMLAGMRIVQLQQSLIVQNTELDRVHKNLKKTHAQLEDDLRTAAKLQQVHIPPSFNEFEQWAIATVYRPCTFIGGDLVGYFPISSNEIGAYSIDVAGHGISAALKTATLAQSLNPYEKMANLAFKSMENGQLQVRQPHELVAELNRRHQDNSETDQYFTIAYTIINRNTGKVRMCQAGHPNPLVLRKNERSGYVGEGGVPVGLFPFAEYETIEFILHPGDRLFMFSDGVTECEKPDGSLLDEDGLLEMLGEKPDVDLKKFSSFLIDHLSSIHGHEEFTDDVSGLLIDPWPTFGSTLESAQGDVRSTVRLIAA